MKNPAADSSKGAVEGVAVGASNKEAAVVASSKGVAVAASSSLRTEDGAPVVAEVIAWISRMCFMLRDSDMSTQVGMVLCGQLCLTDGWRVTASITHSFNWCLCRGNVFHHSL